jgi:RHS Repeat
VDYVYDRAGRLSRQLLPGNRTITYTYDPTTKNLVSLAGRTGSP